jgi:hypothetical protein
MGQDSENNTHQMTQEIGEKEFQGHCKKQQKPRLILDLSDGGYQGCVGGPVFHHFSVSGGEPDPMHSGYDD